MTSGATSPDGPQDDIAQATQMTRAARVSERYMRPLNDGSPFTVCAFPSRVQSLRPFERKDCASARPVRPGGERAVNRADIASELRLNKR